MQFKTPFQQLPENADKPILDWATLNIDVKSKESNPGFVASDLVESAFGTADVRYNKRNGTVVRSGAVHVIRNAETGGVLRVCAKANNQLMLKGNPMKWLFGQNAFCCYEPRQVMVNAAWSWCTELFSKLSADVRGKFALGACHFSTVHLAMMYEASSALEAQQMLADMQYNSACGNRTREAADCGVYFGKSSKHHTVKIYRDPSKPCTSAPQKMSGRCLRVEVVLRDDLIAQHFHEVNGSQYQGFMRTDLRKVFDAEVSALRTIATNTTTKLIPSGLTDAQLGVYVRWFYGCLEASREKLRYHHDAILKATGTDIYHPRVPEQFSEAFKQTSVLDWMRQRNVTNKYGQMAAVRN